MRMTALLLMFTISVITGCSAYRDSTFTYIHETRTGVYKIWCESNIPGGTLRTMKSRLHSLQGVERVVRLDKHRGLARIVTTEYPAIVITEGGFVSDLTPKEHNSLPRLSK